MRQRILPTRPPSAIVCRCPPGTYTARLTVDGAAKTQPIVVRLDPAATLRP
jgi:hypothetical protein